MATSEFLYEAWVAAKLYRVSWFPGIKLGSGVDGEDSFVKIEVYSVSQDTLKRLDYYEGAPDLFTRVEASLYEPADKVFIYEFNGPVKEEDLVASGDWLA